MSQRLNKNGIRVLDDPKENKLQSRRLCLPGEHKFKFVSQTEIYGEGSIRNYECERCGEQDQRGWWE